MNLDECLPDSLRGPDTQIAKIAVGLSGAGVYRVAAAGHAYVLKIANAAEPLADWQRRLATQRAAADAGVAPRVIHADDTRRAVVTEFIADRSFVASYADPRTHLPALMLLGRALRATHDIPLAPDARSRNLHELLAMVWKMSSTAPEFGVPAFVADVAARMLAEVPPPQERANVTSHNDVNPTNLAFDGERVILMDWDTAGANDPLYDLAAIAVFLRMDEETCLALLTAHDAAIATELPARFHYFRRFIATLCGLMFLHLARIGGHRGDASLAREAALSLEQVYGKMRSGELAVSSPDGQWTFGLALVKTV